MKSIVPIILFLVVGALTSATAAETLTLARARTLALAQSKPLQEALASVDAASLNERLQGYASLPSISASATGSASLSAQSSELGATVGLAIKQPIFDPTQSTLTAIARLTTSAARVAARGEYFAVLDTIDSAFYDAAKASAAEAAAQSDLDSARASEQLAHAKLGTGMISPVDYLKQQATVASDEATLVAAQGTLRGALRTVASLTGITAQIEVAPVDDKTSEKLIERFASLTDTEAAAFAARIEEIAIGNNPSLQGASLSYEKAQLNIDRARAGYLPSVSASLAGSVDLTGALQGSATLSVSVPIDPWTTGTTVSAEVIAARQSEMARAEARRSNAVAIEQAVYNLMASAKSVAASQKALEYAEGYSTNIQEKYRLSTASAADLSDAATLVSSNRSLLITARYQFLATLSILRSLAGVEGQDLLVKLLP